MGLRRQLEILANRRPAPQDSDDAKKAWSAELDVLLPKLRAAEEAYVQSLRASAPTRGGRRTRKHRSRRRRSRRHH